MQKVFVRVGETDQEARRVAGEGGAEILADYGDRLLVRATAKALRGLTKAGLSWEVAEGLDSVVVAGKVIDTAAPRAGAARAAGARRRGPPEPDHWLLQFVGPLLPAWVQAVRDLGARVLGPVPENGILAAMDDAQADQCGALPFVQWVGRYDASYKVGPGVVPEGGTAAPRVGGRGRRRAPVATVAIEVTVFDRSDLEAVRAEIERLGGAVRRADVDTVVCDLPAEAVAEVAALRQVASVERHFPPVLFLDQARAVTAVQYGIDTHGLDGDGEIVAVADTGLDVGNDGPTLHQDFKHLDGTAGRVIGHPLGRTAPALWDDPNGHGTHVAGTVLGNGRTGPAERVNQGVACRARLVMQSTLDAGGGLGGIPANLEALLNPPYNDDGARVHTNSWGRSATPGQYNNRARDVDEVVWLNPDLVVLFAAGNEGKDANADGITDFFSLNPHATFRNGISVGGCENNKGTIAITYGANWPGDFPAAPLNGDKISDNPAQMMGFSSRGPALVPVAAAPAGFPAGFGPDRTKPDVVAPGMSILAPYSSRWTALTDPSFASGTTAFGPFNAASGYVLMGGTSMATPHVAGMCALVRQYLRRVHGLSDPENANRRRRRPSAALVKALLVHGAQRIQGGYPGFDNCGTVPGNHQGWGRVDLKRSLFSHPTAAQIDAADAGWLPRRTVFVDDPARTLNGLPAADPASRRTHEVRVRVADRSVPLRATLAWTDYPGAVGHPGSVINRLQLGIVRGAAVTVPVAPAGMAPAPAVNVLNNNVQQIDVTNPELDEYVIRVSATAPLPSVAVAGAEQDFALVISGALSHSDHRNPGTLAALPDLAFVDFAPTAAGAARHDGLAPSPERPANDDGSPDVWLARAAESPEGGDAARLDHAEAGTRCSVYARVRNLGFAPANGAEVSVYWADPAGPLSWPGDWSSEGFRVDGVTGNRRAADVPARARAAGAWNDGETVVGPFEWDPPRGRERVALLVRATHPDDPVAHEGDPRWDNNLTRRDVFVQDNTTQVQGQPGGWDRFLFWLISGFGSPRDVEARLLVSYQDLRDGQVKPVPTGVAVEVWDYDPVTGDDRLAEGRTAASVGPDGRPASAVHLTFSTAESGERGPDLYVKVLRPSGAEFEEFLASSFFAGGAQEWLSREIPEADGGFYREDFDGDRLGLDGSAGVVLRPAGIRVNAAFESLDVVSGEFRPFPQGIPVRVLDANPDASPALLATAVTGEDGTIAAVVPRREGYNPSLYFLIEKDPANDWFTFVGYFASEDRWDSRQKQAEVVAAGGGATAREGLFRDWAQDTLLASGERLRFRLESPGIQVHLRFQYFDREAGAQADLPAGVEVELWEDGAAGRSLVTAAVGEGGRLEATVPKGGRARLDLFARVLMRRRLSSSPDDPLQPAAQVRKAGNLVHWDTRATTAVGGASGTFTGAETAVGTAAAPLLFQIGTGPADASDEHAAPFVLRVLGEVHDWLRSRTGGDWTGGLGVTAELVSTGAANGSTFDATDTIRLNTAHGGAAPDHWSRAVVAHHMGHLAFERFFLFPGRTAPAVPNHHGYDPGAEQPNQQRRVLAEGWADYVANVHRTPPVGPDVTPGQTGWRGTDNDGADSSGEIVPVAVANALWRLDQDVLGRGTAGIADPLNQRRFRALLWHALGALPAEEARQTPFELYRALQAAPLAADALIAPHDAAFVRQEVRRAFEANGLVFTRGKIEGVNRVTAQNLAAPNPVPETWRVRAAPVDRGRLNVAALGRIAAYRVQARVAGQPGFVDLDPVVEVTRADQKAEVVINVTQARQSGVLAAAGPCDLRILVRDEFGAWDTFADDFTGNAAAAVTTNDHWQRNRLASVSAGPGNVP